VGGVLKGVMRWVYGMMNVGGGGIEGWGVGGASGGRGGRGGGKRIEGEMAG